MRNLSNVLLDKISKKFGVEAELLLGVKWTDSHEVFYSSHDVVGARRSILSIGQLDVSDTVEASSTQSATVTLSDTDGHFTEILDTVDIHKRPARIYLSFAGVPISESLLLLDGEINSEVEWSEGSRSITLTVLSRIEGHQFGFSASDGLFEEVDDQTGNTPWPFRFGLTCLEPTVVVKNGVQGFLRAGQGAADPTLDARICQAKQITCPDKSDVSVENSNTDATAGTPTDAYGAYLQKLEEETTFDPSFNPFGNQPNQPGNVDDGYSPDGQGLGPDQTCQRTKFKILCQLLRDKVEQEQHVGSTLEIGNGGLFPQGVTTSIKIGDVIYEGVFSGETFTIQKTIRNDIENVLTCKTQDAAGWGYRVPLVDTPSTLAECSEPGGRPRKQLIGGAGDLIRRLSEFNAPPFIWLPGGSTVLSTSSSTIVHVVSAVPGTVTAVAAYRTFGDTQVLTTVPTDYYEVVTTDYGDLDVVEIHLPRELSTIEGENWSDELFVTFDSDVGPNPVEVMEWIIGRYTDFDADPISFAAVKTKLANYPCNYNHNTKESALTTLTRIAFEARCTLTVSGDTFKLHYLPDEPSSLRTFTESDIVSGTFSYRLSRTEDLKTSSKVTWSVGGAASIEGDSTERSLTVERNADKYGIFPDNQLYRTINNRQQALKTSTFWSIRDANSWKIVKFSTTLRNLDLELYDCIDLNISRFPAVKAVVTQINYNPDSSLVDIEAWTPVLAGTKEEYFWAWPAGKPSGIPYPSDNYELPVPRVSVTPPEDHPLFVEPADLPAVATVGDRFPSDIGDAFPPDACFDPTDAQVIEDIQPQFSRIETDFETEAAETDKAEEAGVNFAAAEDNTDKGPCSGVAISDSCLYQVRVLYGTATGVSECGTGGGCNDTVGGFCAGTQTDWWCRTFGSFAMAEAYRSAVQTQIQMEACKWTKGKTGPRTVSAVTPFGDSGCQDVGDVDTHQPVNTGAL